MPYVVSINKKGASTLQKAMQKRIVIDLLFFLFEQLFTYFFDIHICVLSIFCLTISLFLIEIDDSFSS